MAETVICTSCGQPLNEQTRMLRAIANPLIGLLSQRITIGRGGRLLIRTKSGKDGVVGLGEEVAAALVPYIVEAAVHETTGTPREEAE